MSARIHRIGVAVKDLDAAVEYYSALFGVPFERTGEAVSQEAGVAVAANWQLGIELVQPVPGSANPIAQQMEKHLAEKGDGIFAAGFTSDDIDGDMARAETAGVKQLLPTFRFTEQQLREEFAGAFTRFEETVFDTYDSAGAAYALNVIDDA